MKKVRFGIIGLGNQGTYYARLFNENKIENGILSAVCDVEVSKLENFINKQSNKNIAVFTDYLEMVDSGVCDAVLIVVPHYQHPEMVVECLKRGINVICDKPAGVYTKQVREMNEFAKKCDAKFTIMFNQRTSCLYRKMKEIIGAGGIGKLQRVTWIITDWFRNQAYYNSGSWRATWKGEGGGVLINQCPHQLDLMQWVVGEKPSKVRAFCHYGKWHDIEVEDDVTAYFEYKSGATGVFITTTGEMPGTNRFEVSGTEGKLLCENGKLYSWKNESDSQNYSYTAKTPFETFRSEYSEIDTDGASTQHAGIINNFANALVGLEELYVDGVEGINGVELMNAIELSGWNDGELIRLPIDESRYFTELEEHRKRSKDKNKSDTVSTDATGELAQKYLSNNHSISEIVKK